jgi:competence protein ComEC
VISSACFLLILIQPFSPRGPGDRLEITFLDVRQGDCAFVHFPDRTAWLIDGGGMPAQGFGEDFTGEEFDIGERVVSPFLWSKGVKAIEVMILTHAHHDHIAGLVKVLDNFSVKELWLGKNPSTAEYLRFACKAVQKGLRIRFFAAGDQVTAHGTKLIFLNPPKTFVPGPKPSNNDSLTFRMDYGQRSILMTGDIERKVETFILQSSRPIRTSVLKVPHQGSRSSSTSEFLSQVRPAIAVISVGTPNPFGHPHREVLRRLIALPSQVFRTDQDGAVTVSTDGRLLEVRDFCERQPTTDQLFSDYERDLSLDD